VRTSRKTTVAEVLTTSVASVAPSTPIPDVAATLYNAAVRALPVLDEDGSLLGVISEADLLAAVAAPEHADARWWRLDISTAASQRRARSPHGGRADERGPGDHRPPALRSPPRPGSCANAG
jgi:CBS domain-containing protein